MAPLFSSKQKGHTGSAGRKSWVLFVAAVLAVGIWYTSMKELHGMVQYHTDDMSDDLNTFTERESSQVVEENEEMGSKGEEEYAEEEEDYYGDEVRLEGTREEEGAKEKKIPHKDNEEVYDDDQEDLVEEEEVTSKRAEKMKEDQSSFVCPKGFVIKPNTDFWGDALVWGNENKLDSEEECCKACTDYKPKNPGDPGCNVWVYCGNENLCNSNYRHCWLKHLLHPEGTSPASEGPMVGWTSGVFMKAAPAVNYDDTVDRKYHIVVSAQGASTHWQSRIHYYWYKKIKKQCEEQAEDRPCHMGGFTRLLHSGKADDLMDEIPTFVAQELPKEHPHHGYIVLNRPYAFLQWVQKAKIKEKYVLMGEPDHIWLKPMPNLMDGEDPAAFPFFYIEPTTEKNLPITEKFTGKLETLEQKSRLFPIGNSPTLLSMKDMRKIVPLWYNISLAVHNDEEAAKEWGWIQEMYAFTISMYLAGIERCGLFIDMMAQPPWDHEKDKYYLLHYTYGMDYTLDGTFTPGKYGEWRFDKRSYGEKPIPRNLGPPPDGMQNDLVRHLINAFNEATDAIPDWDSYVKSGHAKILWNGEFP